MANTTIAIGVGSIVATGAIPDALRSLTAQIAGTIPDIKAAITVSPDATAQIAGRTPRISSVIRTGGLILGDVPLITGALNLTSPNLLSIDGVIPEITAVITIKAGTVARIAGVVPLLRSSIYVGSGIGGLIPAITSEFIVTTEVHATLAGVVPHIASSINVLSEAAVVRIAGVVPLISMAQAARIAGVVPGVVSFIRVAEGGLTDGWALNPRTGAVTRLQGWPFTQMAKVGADTYAVGPGGLYRLGGDTQGDGTTPVAWQMETGLSDLGSPAVKHWPYVYLDGIVDGEIEISFLDDRGNVYRYRYHGMFGAEHRTHRRKLGNAIRSRNGAYRIGSPTGAYFELDSLEPEVNLTQRSV